MSDETDGINVTLLSLTRFDDKALANNLLAKMLHCGLLKLHRFGHVRPLEGRIRSDSLASIVDCWFQAMEPSGPHFCSFERMLNLENSRDGSGFMVTWDLEESHFNMVCCMLASRQLNCMNRVERLFVWLKDVVQLINPVYGSIDNCMTRGWSDPYDLKVRLPDIPWGSIFGAPYIDLFGRDKLLQAPYLQVEEWGSGHIFCQLTEDLMDPDLPKNRRQQVREFLGKDSFMERPKVARNYKSGIAPDFGLYV